MITPVMVQSWLDKLAAVRKKAEEEKTDLSTISIVVPYAALREMVEACGALLDNGLAMDVAEMLDGRKV